jgi:hypothetical protein
VNGEPQYQRQIPSLPSDRKDKVLDGTFPDREDGFLPHVPNAFRNVIRRAMQVNPKDRHPSATDLQDELAKVSPVHDWQVRILPDDEITWRSAREGKPDLVVERRRDEKKWMVEHFTDGTVRRNKTSQNKQTTSL